MSFKVFIIGDALNYRMTRKDVYSTERFIKALKQEFIPSLNNLELEQVADNLVTKAKYLSHQHENCELWLALADDLKTIIQQHKNAKHEAENNL